MQDQDENKPPEEAGDPELVRPIADNSDGSNGDNYNISVLAQQFTHRPDLVLDSLEAGAPGFKARFAESIEQSEREAQDDLRERRRLGREQLQDARKLSIRAAYAIIAAIIFVCVLGVILGRPVAWLVLVLFIGFAVVQSGSSGFLQIASGLREMLSKWKNND